MLTHGALSVITGERDPSTYGRKELNIHSATEIRTGNLSALHYQHLQVAHIDNQVAILRSR